MILGPPVRAGSFRDRSDGNKCFAGPDAVVTSLPDASDGRSATEAKYRDVGKFSVPPASVLLMDEQTKDKLALGDLAKFSSAYPVGPAWAER